jgi:hypothetical protein
MIDKYDLLKNTQQSNLKRIILVGGSNVAFGFDSDMIAKETNKECINMGLLAGIGLDIYLNMVKKYGKNGDIIVLCLEFPLYSDPDISYEHLLKIVENHYYLYQFIGIKQWASMLGKYPNYVFDKMKYFLTHTQPVHYKNKAYNRANFNKHGDVSFERPDNIMKKGFLVDKGTLISADIISYNFIKKINKFCDYVNKKGATVYVSFPSRNESASNFSDKQINNFCIKLESELDAEIISDIYNYILPAQYFYDTNYHLNDKGVNLRTSILLKDLKAIGL